MAGDTRDIVIGRVVAPFGIQGEVKFICETDFPERFDVGRSITLKLADGQRREVKIERSREQKGAFVLKLSGIDTRNDAEEIRAAAAVVGEEDLAELEEDEFYIFDLLGIKVVTDDGRELGVVEEVLQAGPNDVYVTSTGVCIPGLKSVVAKVDLENATMIVHPVPGLLAEE